MADNSDAVKTVSKKIIKVEFTLALEVNDGKVDSRISFKAMDGVSIEAMQMIGRKVQVLKKSLEGVFASEGSANAEEKGSDDEETPAPEETPSNGEEV